MRLTVALVLKNNDGATITTLEVTEGAEYEYTIAVDTAPADSGGVGVLIRVTSTNNSKICP